MYAPPSTTEVPTSLRQTETSDTPRRAALRPAKAPRPTAASAGVDISAWARHVGGANGFGDAGID